MAEHGFKYAIQVPKMTKVTLNIGLKKLSTKQNEDSDDRRNMEGALDDLTRITGQKPNVTTVRKSEATFKIRAGDAIGCMVTLRRARMYEFVERLIGIALPRTRDFRGLNPRAFDGRGNFSMGITEQIIFPEIDYDKITRIRGMNITITTTARNDEEGLALLRKFNFPFRN